MNIVLLRDSFEAVKPYAKEFVAHFYKTMFEKYPDAKGFFHKTDMKKQQELLIQSLVYVVDHVDKPDELTDYLRKLGKRHHENYGTKAEHYGIVADSLLTTLAYFFEETWTPELQATWSAALQFIAETMQSYTALAPSPQVEKVPEPVNVAEDFQRHVNRVVQDALLKALRDPKVHEEVRRVAAAQAHKILMQALQEELANFKKEAQPKQAA